MKKFIIFCLIAIVFLACKEKQQTSHEVQWSGNAKDSVVYVNHQNQDGSFSNFYMNYFLYSTLFRQSGYSGVNSYYNSHRSEFNNQSRYENYTNYKRCFHLLFYIQFNIRNVHIVGFSTVSCIC